MTELIARFDVAAFEPSTVPGIDADWVAASVLRKTFTGGLTGTSVVHFVWSGDETNRAYLAAERIIGALADGGSGEVTVHHWGTQFGEQSSGGGVIVTGSGTGAFADWAGPAIIEHDDEGPYFRFPLK